MEVPRRVVCQAESRSKVEGSKEGSYVRLIHFCITQLQRVRAIKKKKKLNEWGVLDRGDGGDVVRVERGRLLDYSSKLCLKYFPIP